MLATVARGLESDSPIHVKSWTWEQTLTTQHWGGRDKQVTEAHWLASLSNRLAPGAVRDPVSKHKVGKRIRGTHNFSLLAYTPMYICIIIKKKNMRVCIY